MIADLFDSDLEEDGFIGEFDLGFDVGEDIFLSIGDMGEIVGLCSRAELLMKPDILAILATRKWESMIAGRSLGISSVILLKAKPRRSTPQRRRG